MSWRIDRDSSGGDGDVLLAGEYVLGVLDATERREVEARMAADADFATEVGRWQARLAPWFAQPDAAVPSPHVWPRIRRGIGLPAVGGNRIGLWNNTGFWRATTGLAVAAGLVAVAIGVRAPQQPAPESALPGTAVEQVPPSPAEQPVVVLSGDDGATGWLATVDPRRDTIRMVPVPAALPTPDVAGELWLIAPDQAPRSLGLVSSELAQTVAVPEVLRNELVAGALLAVTFEPRAGIPHAAPTGAIVATGTITEL